MKKLENFKKFRCWKVFLYRSCSKCSSLNDGCDYAVVFEREHKLNFNPCPICFYKNTSICGQCHTKTNKNG